MGAVIAITVLVFLVLVTAIKTIRVVPQAYSGIVERLGRYHKTLQPGLNIVIPFIDKVMPLIDMREQVVSFSPQPVITEDNVVVQIDSVLYYTINNARDVTYEIADHLSAIEQLTTTTLRNVVGGLSLEKSLTSRDEINNQLRAVLDEATTRWGVRVNRVELKAIDPPSTIQDAMEQQMRAEREKRAAILTAEGVKQSQILTAEGQKQSEILKAEGNRQSQILNAEGESQAIQTVFNSIHKGNPDEKLITYKYVEAMTRLAESDNKTWIIPGELTAALSGLGSNLGSLDNNTPNNSTN